MTSKHKFIAFVVLATMYLGEQAFEIWLHHVDSMEIAALTQKLDDNTQKLILLQSRD